MAAPTRSEVMSSMGNASVTVSPVEDDNPVSQIGYLVEISGDHNHSTAGLGGSEAAIAHGLGRLGVEPLRRPMGHQNSGVLLELSRRHQLLLVPARQRAGLGCWFRRTDLEPLGQFSGVAGNLVRQSDPETGEAPGSHMAGGSVVGHRECCGQSGGAVFMQVGDPGGRWPRRADPEMSTPSTKTWPLDSLTCPVRALARDSWPLPAMPTTPRISPPATSKSRP